MIRKTWKGKVVQTPLPATTGGYVTFHVRLPATLHARMVKAAAQEEISLNALAIRLLTAGVAK